MADWLGPLSRAINTMTEQGPAYMATPRRVCWGAHWRGTDCPGQRLGGCWPVDERHGRMPVVGGMHTRPGAILRAAPHRRALGDALVRRRPCRAGGWGAAGLARVQGRRPVVAATIRPGEALCLCIRGDTLALLCLFYAGGVGTAG